MARSLLVQQAIDEAVAKRRAAEATGPERARLVVRRRQQPWWRKLMWFGMKVFHLLGCAAVFYMFLLAYGSAVRRDVIQEHIELLEELMKDLERLRKARR